MEPLQSKPFSWANVCSREAHDLKIVQCGPDRPTDQMTEETARKLHIKIVQNGEGIWVTEAYAKWLKKDPAQIPTEIRRRILGHLVPGTRSPTAPATKSQLCFIVPQNLARVSKATQAECTMMALEKITLKPSGDEGTILLLQWLLNLDFSAISSYGTAFEAFRSLSFDWSKNDNRLPYEPLTAVYKDVALLCRCTNVQFVNIVMSAWSFEHSAMYSPEEVIERLLAHIPIKNLLELERLKAVHLTLNGRGRELLLPRRHGGSKVREIEILAAWLRVKLAGDVEVTTRIEY
ncbi:hypothetical protein LTR56_014574 [Elasticomyces elasticus]|nr:hypothetical protein LTR56_014574 [Elasticomyces elasticus]KAK3646794.1 hypothetical protein LTR22_014170 [Elasticomyces elasticus]KAK4916363.1 hypothetical protein LTR49_015597 [Elasticomyces elasticus]KAK5755835.1 hypothetical protein LTS12_014066 [Elasticomyces elasticus]